MSQRHGAQHGIFHVTTNAAKKNPWLTMDGVPNVIIDNLMMTRNVHRAQVHAFCILPDHMHIILTPGEKGLSSFIHSFKRNSSKDIRSILGVRSAGSLPARYANHDAVLARKEPLLDHSNDPSFDYSPEFVEAMTATRGRLETVSDAWNQPE